MANNVGLHVPYVPLMYDWQATIHGGRGRNHYKNSSECMICMIIDYETDTRTRARVIIRWAQSVFFVTVSHIQQLYISYIQRKKDSKNNNFYHVPLLFNHTSKVHTIHKAIHGGRP